RSRQQHVGDEYEKRSDREYDLRQDVVEVAERDAGGHYRGAPEFGRGLPSGPHGVATRKDDVEAGVVPAVVPGCAPAAAGAAEAGDPPGGVPAKAAGDKAPPPQSIA